MKFLIILLSAFIFTQTSLAKDSDKPKEEFTIDQIKSVMLSDAEIAKINHSLKLFKEGKEFIILDTKELSDEERRRLKKQKISAEMKLIREKSRLYLGSVLYFSNKVWSIWINKKKITAMSNKKSNEFYIQKINGQKVDIIWTLGLSKWKILTGSSVSPKVNALNQIEIKITLRPNQTFLLRGGKIIEGSSFKKTSNKNIISNNK